MKHLALHFVVILAFAISPIAGGAIAQAPPAPVTPSVKCPAEVKVAAGRLASIEVTTNGKTVKVVNLSSDHIDVIREYDPTTFLFRAGGDPGTYRLAFYTALGDVPSAPAYCTLTIGDPVPPTPPTPPTPTDPLTAALQSAYTAETDTAKATLKTSLAAFYRVASTTAQATPEATWGGYFGALKTIAASLGVAGKLPGVQAAAQVELTKALPSVPTQPLDSAGRASAQTEFKKLADALDTVK